MMNPFFQIYNEMIRDLLNPSSGILDLREDSRGNVQVAGLSEVTAESTEEVGSRQFDVLYWTRSRRMSIKDAFLTGIWITKLQTKIIFL